MEVLTKTEVFMRKNEIVAKIKEGAIFVYPTDTIYGIGCNALLEKSVSRIREIKERATNPFSVWAPTIKWIKDICSEPHCKELASKLPGPYTFIIRLKKKGVVAKSVNLGSETLGVRYPNHWFGKIIEEANVPIVTTSVNKAGNPFMTDLKNMDKDVEQNVDFIIFEGEKEARPSKIINLAEGTVKER
ncbi:threonylcarbamoyl-AMP synthase [Candidatus Woesearchaeota archaeon]|nr:threonylcarbamoyl-AMP synthase [Candidatus Woesearchaeota archaeon]